MLARLGRFVLILTPSVPNMTRSGLISSLHSISCVPLISRKLSPRLPTAAALLACPVMPPRRLWTRLAVCICALLVSMVCVVGLIGGSSVSLHHGAFLRRLTAAVLSLMVGVIVPFLFLPFPRG